MSSKKIFVTGLTVTSASDLEGVGTVRQVGNKWYKWVKYTNATGAVAAVAGNVCYYHKDVGYDSHEVTSDLSEAATNVGAGVLQAVIPDAGYGWIQIKGYAIITTALTAGADGNALTAVGATDGTLDVSGAVTDFVCAVALDASAKKVILDCPW
jgi:hypothetical protein